MAVAECGCGGALEVGEAELGQELSCPFCRAVVRAVAGVTGACPAVVDTFTSRLIIAAGPDRIGEQFLLGGEGTIGLGKLASNPIRFATPMVSRNHCELQRTPGGGWLVSDRNSTNGLFVNRQRVTAHELKDGDIVRVGEYELRFDSSRGGAPVVAILREDASGGDSLPMIVESGDAPKDLYDFVEPAAPPLPGTPAGKVSDAPPAPKAGPLCPSCRQTLPFGAKICVDCGINIDTGRSLITSKDLDEDDLANRADTWIRLISCILPLGLFPIASEAFATKKAHVTWAITIVTVLASAMFFVYMKSTDEPDVAALNLMHWTGSQAEMDKKVERVSRTLERQYRDDIAAESKDGQLTAEGERRAKRQALDKAATLLGAPDGVGFRWYQLFTHALLHGGILHLAGNLVFLLVFGMRVNEMVGTTRMAILYPLLAAGSAGIDSLAHLHQPLQAGVGASGAIMGLAGMYLVFFPVQRVHMALWIRLRVWVWYKLFTLRGFWLLVFWIALNDGLMMMIGSEDHVAHWAHLGGFAVGVAAALTLLLSKQVNAGGGDLLSVALGKRAWALLGKPSEKPLPA